MPAPAPAAHIEHAVQDYLTGESSQAVAIRYGVSQERLRRVLVERGLWRTRAETNALRARHTGASILAKSDLPAEEIVERYLAGESVNALSKAYGTSRTAIEYRLKAAGVERRGSLEANRLIMAERTPEENARNMVAAHAASRGRTVQLETKIKTAKTREKIQSHASDHEKWLARELARRGVDFTPQKAVGPYNVDLAAFPVAVEVFGGGWHAYGRHRKRAPERLRYILDEGWNLVIIWASANRWPVGPGACDYIVTFAEEARRDPALRGQYRVIWGDGKDATIPGLDVDDLSVKPSRSGRKRPGARHELAG